MPMHPPVLWEAQSCFAKISSDGGVGLHTTTSEEQRAIHSFTQALYAAGSLGHKFMHAAKDPPGQPGGDGGVGEGGVGGLGGDGVGGGGEGGAGVGGAGAGGAGVGGEGLIGTER